MKIAVMQPYFFPYIGYWQLINVVDTFVIYDDVSYIKGGYINRNNLLGNSNSQLVTLELIGASSNKQINQIKIADNSQKILKTISQNYSKAPFFEDFFPVLVKLLSNKEKKLSRFIGNSLIVISQYLNVDTNFVYSSDICNDKQLNSQARLIEISKLLNANYYVNSIGGTKLYNKDIFSENDINLRFIKSDPISYKQFDNSFVPNLSIIDVIMFNSIDDIKLMLNRYDLI